MVWRTMKILIALTYYRPHVSGLTIYVERMARALAARGHAVTVLTSQYDKALARDEQVDGVRVLRAPVAARVSKGVVMPTIGWMANALVPAHDVLSLHLPQLDAAGIAVRGRFFNKPTTLTYHSDLFMPPGLLNATAERVIMGVNHLAARMSDRLVAYTDDFARHSRFLSKYLRQVEVIPPPVEMPIPTEAELAAFKAQHNATGRRPVLGLAVRLAAEKGVEHLFEALPHILERHPDTLILHAGPREALGEAEYLHRLNPLIERYRDHYLHLGTLTPAQMAVFFSACDVHVLPSVNSTETFGLVQIEAALCGTPSVASALPGVRMPTRMTGMGLTAPPRDVPRLADAILEVIEHRDQYVKRRGPIADQFSPASNAAQYEHLFLRLLEQKRR
jgi:glycosyltransferase involved in cell wall biosynthesis